MNYQLVKPSPSSMLTLLKVGIVLCWIGWAVFYSLTVSINIPIIHMDGAFQTASGLYRLDAGQVPGKDFYPYLGVGPLFIMFPFFKLLGANISASVFSAHLTIFIFVMLSFAFICHLMWRPKSYLSSLAGGVLLFSASIAPAVLGRYLYLPTPEFTAWGIDLPNFTWWGLNPGNSLRPLRSIAPYLAAIILYFYIFKIVVARRKYLFAGVLSGMIMLWSNDFAISTAALLVIPVSGHALSRKEFHLKNVFFYFSSALVSWLLLLTLVTLGHPLELLRYNFIDVGQDQWWYFGPYGESGRVFSIAQLTKLFFPENYFPLLILAFTTVLALKTRLVEHALLLWIGIALFSGGVISSVGGHIGGYYFSAFSYWAMVVAIAGFGRLSWLGLRRFSSTDCNCKLQRLFALLSISALLLFTSFNQYKTELSGARNDTNRFLVPELGGYLGNDWKDYVALVRGTPKDKSVFEEYWGLWSAILGKFSAWPVDSHIHALGHIREIASTQLLSADIVVSSRYSMSPGFQPWNVSQSYWFYENLLKKWSVSYLSPTTVVWLKSASPSQLKTVECTVNGNAQSLNLQISTPGFYEIDVRYKLIGDGRFLAMIRNNISVGDDANGYVSVDPKGTQLKFLAYVSSPERGELDTMVIGSNDGTVKFDISSCSANYLPFNNQNVLHVRSQEDFYLTDGNWERGVSRQFTGFFVPNTAEYSNAYIPEKLVKFKNGESRTILRAEPRGEYLHIYVSGALLNTHVVGIPNEFVVVGKQKTTRK